MFASSLKQQIQAALRGFASHSDLSANALTLFTILDYQSNRTLKLPANTAQGFQDHFGFQLNPARALLADWQTVDVLFQITDAEMQQQNLLFNSTVQVDNTCIESYLFFAIRLHKKSYTRTELATITREVNQHFPMPILLLFQHGETLTLSIINRRLHKRDISKDVLEKVTLIKDIRTANPHRAHLEILADLALPNLAKEHPIGNFVELQRAWENSLSSSELNKRFYREIANWYFWATQNVTFPAGGEPEVAKRNDIAIIRLITRLIFVWFVKEKGLIPLDLFNEAKLKELLTDMSPTVSTYYRAILQNLFFATLNQEMGKREFCKKNASGERDQNRLITTLYRYQDYFVPDKTDELLKLLRDIPFLNGGLFECLDYEDELNKVIRIDGFSDEQKNPLSVPNFLFFAQEQDVDLNKTYATKGKHYKVRGLLRILHSYKFTVTENTPIEEEIALDPELLGQVFENLLAAYNPETGATARKQTGSFYTPREIVNYMVDESLLAYLVESVAQASSLLPKPVERDRQDAYPPPAFDRQDAYPTGDRLRHLLAYNHEEPQFSEEERRILIQAIANVKVLDPACGSGAFPIGVLQKLVFLLAKLDPQNQLWKATQMAKANQIDEAKAREAALETLDRAFDFDNLDYARKLYLIQNCIYGVDIQPIAVQIAKLRCFIALIVDQQTDNRLENRGILALPNLETRFVAANTLLSAKIGQGALRSSKVVAWEKELSTVRQRHFEAKTPQTKRKYRDKDQYIRQQLSVELKHDGMPGATADLLTQWNPYDQNTTAPFFDAEWMFGITEGFAIVVGNPPYVRHEKIKEFKPAFQQTYSCYTGVTDLYVYFYECGLNLLKAGGILTYISSNKYFRAGYGNKLRHFLSSKVTIQQIIDFGDAPVFNAIAYPSIIVVKKQPPVEQTSSLFEGVEQTSSLFEGVEQTSSLFEGVEQTSSLFEGVGQASSLFEGVEQTSSLFEGAEQTFSLFEGVEQTSSLFEGVEQTSSLFEGVEQTSSLFEGVEQTSSLSDRQDACPTGHIRVLTWQPGAAVSTFANVFATQSFLLAQKELTAEGWRLEVPTTLRLLEKLQKAGIPLVEYVQKRFYIGIITGLNEAFVVDQTTRDRLIAEHPSSAEILKPLLRGRDVKRWQLSPQDLWLIFTRRGVDIAKYPAIRNHLLHYKARLTPGLPGGRKPGNYQWFEISDKIDYWQEFEKPKIIYPTICKRNEFAWDETGYYVNQKAFIIPGASKYLLGVLNSSVIFWLFKNLLAKLQGGFFEPSAIFMKPIPIPVAPPAQQAAIEAIVERILAVKQTNPAANVTALEAEIDEQVYRLYGLTAAEVRVVEGTA